MLNQCSPYKEIVGTYFEWELKDQIIDTKVLIETGYQSFRTFKVMTADGYSNRRFFTHRDIYVNRNEQWQLIKRCPCYAVENPHRETEYFVEEFEIEDLVSLV